jgi:hypothetical protein
LFLVLEFEDAGAGIVGAEESAGKEIAARHDEEVAIDGHVGVAHARIHLVFESFS